MKNTSYACRLWLCGFLLVSGMATLLQGNTNDVSRFYLNAAIQADALPSGSAYWIEFKDEGDRRSFEDNDRAAMVLKQVLAGHGLFAATRIEDAAVVIELDFGDGARPVKTTKQVPSEYYGDPFSMRNLNAAALASGRYAEAMRSTSYGYNSAATGVMIVPSGDAVMLGPLSTPPETVEVVEESWIREQYLILRAYNLEGLKMDSPELVEYAQVCVVSYPQSDSEEGLSMVSFLQLAGSYLGKETGHFIVLDRK